MINATIGRINRDPADGSPGGTGAVERMTDDNVISPTITAEATVSPGNVDCPRSIDLGRGQRALAQIACNSMMSDGCDGGDRTPTGSAIGGIEGADGGFVGVINRHNHRAIRPHHRLSPDD